MDNPHSPRPNTSTSSTTDPSHISSDANSNHGWSFLQQSADPNTLPRSLPPSTYIRSSTSTSSRSPRHNSSHSQSRSHSQTLSRSLLNHFSTSTGQRSTTTNPSLPSQPVLLRINANNAYTHSSRMPRRSHCARPVHRDKNTSLPALDEFGIQGILSAISEDIEGDLAVISEVLGRSRFVLADQYESQMAPLGEIRGVGVDVIEEEEISRMGYDVTILREDASLVDGSNSGSAAYGLLERLQAVPRFLNVGFERVVESETVVLGIEGPRSGEDVPVSLPAMTMTEMREPAATRLDGPARAVVSETYLSAEAEGVSSGMPALVDPPVSVRRRGFVSGFDGIASWLSGGSSGGEMDAEARLRGLLNR